MIKKMIKKMMTMSTITTIARMMSTMMMMRRRKNSLLHYCLRFGLEGNGHQSQTLSYNLRCSINLITVVVIHFTLFSFFFFLFPSPIKVLGLVLIYSLENQFLYNMVDGNSQSSSELEFLECQFYGHFFMVQVFLFPISSFACTVSLADLSLSLKRLILLI